MSLNYSLYKRGLYASSDWFNVKRTQLVLLKDPPPPLKNKEINPTVTVIQREGESLVFVVVVVVVFLAIKG